MPYRPQEVPFLSKSLPEFLNDEFRNVADAMNGVQDLIQMRELNEAPTRPRVGMVAYADGTNWDPGSGEGLYVYKSGGWTLIA